MKMRKITCVLVLCLIAVSNHVWAGEPVLKTITAGGFERQYKVYVPSGYDAVSVGEAGLLVCLHGLNRNMDDFFTQYNVTAIADKFNLVVISPNALSEQETGVNAMADKLAGYGMSLNLDAVWGAGVSIKFKASSQLILNAVGLSDFELNENVDDLTFINTIINNTQNEYSKINSQRVFMFGTSLGSFMTYRYAMKHGDSLAGLISVAGLMGSNIEAEKAFTKPIPVCDFHSTTDEVVPYFGDILHPITTPINTTITVGFGVSKDIVVSKWVNWNGAVTTPVVTEYDVPGKPSVKKIVYSATATGAEVTHYELTDALHDYYFKKSNGDAIDYNEEIIAFIGRNNKDITTGKAQLQRDEIAFYPNPACDFIHFNTSEGTVSIYEPTGRKVLSEQLSGQDIDVSVLAKGMYIVRVEAGNKVLTHKLIKE